MPAAAIILDTTHSNVAFVRAFLSCFQVVFMVSLTLVSLEVNFTP